MNKFIRDNSKVILVVAISVLTLIAIVLGLAKMDRDKVIIKVNDGVINEKIIKNALDSYQNSFSVKEKGMDLSKNKLLFLIFKMKVSNELVARELLFQEAKKEGIKVTSKDVKEFMATIKQRFGDDKKFNEFLKENKVSRRDFNRETKKEIYISKLIESKASDSVTDEEVQAFYNKNKNTKFKYPNSIKASHILVLASDAEIQTKLKAQTPDISAVALTKRTAEEKAKALKKAQDLLEKVKANPKDFGKIAKENSQDFASAKQDGDIGFFTKLDVVPEFYNASERLEVGQISPIVKTFYGYHIIKVTEKKPAGTVSFEEAEKDIRFFLTNEKKLEILRGLVAKLQKEAKIEYVDTSYDPKEIEKEIKNLSSKEKYSLVEPQKEESTKETAN